MNCFESITSSAMLALLFAASAAEAGGFPFNATAANAPVLVMRSSGNACNQGDPVTCTGDFAATPAGNKSHLFFVEVPVGTGEMAIELFDADVGAVVTGVGLDANTGRYDYALLDPSNNPVATRFDRGVDTGTGIQTTGAVSVNCQASGGPATADNNWCRLITLSNPAPGHWQIRMTPNGTAGQISSIGVRALDSVTNRDLNVYARSFIHWGNQDVAGRRLYTLANNNNAFYPYVTAGCGLRTYDFDSDNGSEVTIRHTSPVRNSVSVLNGTPPLSVNAQWANSVIALPSANNTQADEYGLWTAEFSVVGGANHVTTWLSPSYITKAIANTQPEAGSFRYYFPTNSGGRPVKPTVRQGLIGVVSGPNVPTVNVDTIYRIGIDINNPTPYPIVFNASNLVTAVVPADVASQVDYGYVGSSFVSSCGAVVAQPANDAVGTVSWNPGTLAAGQSCSAYYEVRVQPLTAGTRLLTEQASLTTGTTAQMLDETGVPFTFGPLCGISITTGTNYNSVPVTLSYVKAERLGSQAQIEFETVSEFGSLWFELVDSRSRDALSARIPARAEGEHEPTIYSLTASPPASGSFYIRQYEVGNKMEEFGPFALGHTHGARLQRAAIDWDAVDSEQAAFRSGQRAPQGGASMALARITQDGLYRISYEALLSEGLDFSGVPAAELALSVDGQALAREVSAPIFGPGEYIEFFAHVNKQPYYGSSMNIYVMRDASRAVSWKKSTLRPGAVSANQQVHTVVLDANREYASASPLPDPWFLRKLTRSNNNMSSISETLNLLAAPGSEAAVLKVSSWGGLDYAEAGADHAYSASVNGTLIGTASFDGINPNVDEFSIPAGVLQAGSNTVTLTLTPTAHLTDRINVESLAIRYTGVAQSVAGVWQSSLPADEGQSVELSDTLFDDGFAPAEQRICADCATVRVAGLAANGLRVFRLAGGVVIEEVLGGRADGADQILALPGAGDYRGYAPLPITSVALAPAPLEPPRDADMLVISHPSFVADVASLVDVRRSEGLQVAVVTTEQILSHESASRLSADALQRYIREAAKGGRLAYVLLVGGDSYDYDDVLQLGSRSFVPTFYRVTHPLIRHAPTDVPFADLDDDGLPDIAVGRFPVRTSAELQALVAKTLQWSVGGPASSASVAVSDRITGGYDFADQSRIMTEGVSFGAQRSLLDLDDYPDDANGNAAARTALVQSINAGLSWVNFYGHASPYQWTFSSFLTAAQVRAGLFANPNTSFIATQWGCWANYFVLPQYDTLAHGLLNSGSGAVALIGASALGETGSSTTLAAYMLPELGLGSRLGDVWKAGLRGNGISNPDMRDVNEATLLMGDPSLPIR